MTNTEEEIAQILFVLQEELRAFIALFERKIDLGMMVYTLWNVKDVLGHITFWHESFARNVEDVSEGRTPHPLKGTLSAVNVMSVESTRNTPVSALLQRLLAAQKVIDTHIVNTVVATIPYKKGSRNYTRLEYLNVVVAHIRRHRKDVEKRVRSC